MKKSLYLCGVKQGWWTCCSEHTKIEKAYANTIKDVSLLSATIT